MQPTPQNNQLMSKHGVLSLKPQRRLEWRGQDGQSETEKPDHSASLGDSITSSTRIRFSVHTAVQGSGPLKQIAFSLVVPRCSTTKPSSCACPTSAASAGPTREGDMSLSYL